MFAATIINFLLSSLNTGTQVTKFIRFIRQALILDIHDPLSKKPASVNNALLITNAISACTETLPVSSNPLLPESVMISNNAHAR